MSIFFNNQLMKSEAQVRLFATHDFINSKTYEVHVGSIRLWLSDLIGEAIREKEDPKRLIEDFLMIPYADGETIDEIVEFLCNTHFMVHAFEMLKDNWSNLDPAAPDDSLLYATGEVDEQRASEIYSEATFRKYLETLTQIYNAN